MTDFTYPGYVALLHALKARVYAFAGFAAAPDLLASGRRFVLLRHDVDFDLEKALQMAELEAQHDVTATYFLMVRSDHYNLFSGEGSQRVSRILELGHRCGLHFDPAAYPGSPGVEALAAACRREVQMLQDWFGGPIDIVSFHRPSELVLSGHPALSAPLPHTYLPLFVRDIQYFSDSRGEWRFGHPCQGAAFAAGRPLHLLVHPIWWGDHPAAPVQLLDDFLRRRALVLEASVARNCSIYRPAAPSPTRERPGEAGRRE